MDKKLRNLRHIIFERDSYTCVLCPQRASDVHHVIARSQGGGNNPHNLVAVCRICHVVLHGTPVIGNDRLPEEARQAVLEYICDCYAEAIEGGYFNP